MKSFTMKKSLTSLKNVGMAITVAALMTACASNKPPKGYEEVRAKLTQLQSDPQLASRAPVALKDAEQAVNAAEIHDSDKAFEAHKVWIADRKVDIAKDLSQAYFYEDQRKELGEKSLKARLDSRTQEVDMARQQAMMARGDADAAKLDANAAKQQADAARQQAEDLQRQIADMDAKTTERGLVVTLGDLLFATGKADLKSNALANLGKLSAFLTKYPDRSIIIEGHTDSVGSESSNMSLSQRRADSVKVYLLNQGVAANRIVSTGKGESTPVADNESAGGRQLNRRVEVIIANPGM